LSRRDDEALEAVLNEMRKNKGLKNSIVQAAQNEEYENFARIVAKVLNSLNRTVDNFVNFVNNAIDWFKNL
jgi:hypothetical protein